MKTHRMHTQASHLISLLSRRPIRSDRNTHVHRALRVCLRRLESTHDIQFVDPYSRL